MDDINDYGMAFENILIASLGRPTDVVYFANYYNDKFGSRALLYTVCAKEMHINSARYSEDEISQMRSLMKELSNDKTYGAIFKTIRFFKNKMKL